MQVGMENEEGSDIQETIQRGDAVEIAYYPVQKEVDRKKVVRNLWEEYETTQREYKLMMKQMEKMKARMEAQLETVRAAESFFLRARFLEGRHGEEAEEQRGRQWVRQTRRGVKSKGKSQAGKREPTRDVKETQMLDDGSAKAICEEIEEEVVQEKKTYV